MRPEELVPFKKTLSGLKAKDGVVSVLGNHDYTYYMNVDDEAEIRRIEEKVQQTEREMGWHLLMNEHFVLHRGKDSIYVAGTENFKKPSRAEVARALYGIKKGQFVLMLQHIPEMWKDTTPSRINEKYGSKDSVLVAPQLTLSGHTHAGMCFCSRLAPVYVLGFRLRTL